MKNLLIPSLTAIIVSGIIAYFAPNTETVYGVWSAGASFILGVFGVMGLALSFIEGPKF